MVSGGGEVFPVIMPVLCGSDRAIPAFEGDVRHRLRASAIVMVFILVEAGVAFVGRTHVIKELCRQLKLRFRCGCRGAPEAVPVSVSKAGKSGCFIQHQK